jgi:translation initiation factor 2 subunit 2
MPEKVDLNDYRSLVARAKSKIPEKKATHERLQVPPPEVLIEGKTTVFRNFGDIAGIIRR